MSNNKDNADELFDLKTAFYLGNYQQAINEAQKLRVNTNLFLRSSKSTPGRRMADDLSFSRDTYSSSQRKKKIFFEKKTFEN